MTNKERMAQLQAGLREAHSRDEVAARMVIELVKLSLDEVKESLVMTVGDDMLRAQGEARYLRKLHKELTTVPPSIRGESK